MPFHLTKNMMGITKKTEKGESTQDTHTHAWQAMRAVFRTPVGLQAAGRTAAVPSTACRAAKQGTQRRAKHSRTHIARTIASLQRESTLKPAAAWEQSGNAGKTGKQGETRTRAKAHETWTPSSAAVSARYRSNCTHARGHRARSHVSRRVRPTSCAATLRRATRRSRICGRARAEPGGFPARAAAQSSRPGFS